MFRLDFKSMDLHFKAAETLATLLDNQFRLFKWKFGNDPILGFFPGIGDLIPLAISFYMIWIGKQMGLPQSEINKMMRNAMFDATFGLIPFLGDLIDFSFKAHQRNLEILKKHKERVVDGELIN